MRGATCFWTTTGKIQRRSAASSIFWRRSPDARVTPSGSGIRTERLLDFLAEHVWRLEDPERYDLRPSYPEPAGPEGESLSTVKPLAVAFR